MPNIGIIGGTGVYNPGMLENVREEVVENRYGQARVAIGLYKGLEVAFLARHGAGHSVPPHLVNYRANITALRDLGVKRIIATAAVGSLNPAIKPGDMVLVDQFLDFTRGRPSTFFTGGEQGVVHCDMTFPYCPDMREKLRQAAEVCGLEVHPDGVYVCAEGPRFETAAEIRMFRMLGGDVVGMTSVPECVLAREMGICYATVAMVTNFAAGITPARLTHTEVLDVMEANTQNLTRLIIQVLGMMAGTRECGCSGILAEIERLRKRKG